jgi:hypothetical protein
MIVQPHGGVTRRPGTEYLGEVKVFTDLVNLGGQPSPPPPPITPLDAAIELTPVRIFFAQGMSPEMSQQLGSTTDRRSTDLADAAYRARKRRELQSEDAADEAVEIIDSTNNPEVLRVCTQHTPEDDSLCEAAGYENSARASPLKPQFALRKPHPSHATPLRSG